jgi:hypothetical protein
MCRRSLSEPMTYCYIVGYRTKLLIKFDACFHFAFINGFSARALAPSHHSLVRVSRRVAVGQSGCVSNKFPARHIVTQILLMGSNHNARQQGRRYLLNKRSTRRLRNSRMAVRGQLTVRPEPSRTFQQGLFASLLIKQTATCPPK